MKHSKEHFGKVKSKKAWNYKTHDVMKEDHMRDNIIKGKLNREECNNEEAHRFLKLLKIPKGLDPGNEEEM